VTQSVSTAHVGLLQAVTDAQVTAPAHAVIAAGVTQVPAPSHRGAARNNAFAQAVVPHVVVVLRKRHPPLPSQVPSCPHAVASTAHLVLDDPPDKIGLHRPLAAPVSVFEHDRQVPVHALSQQIPETHEPCTHSLLPTQTEPSTFFVAQVMAGEQ
jgi:hypothetical protein